MKYKNDLTREELKKYLHYCPDTGIFTRRISTSNRANKGDIAGGIDLKGYINIRVKGQAYKAHRLAYLYVNGSFPEKQIDHINHIRDDNRINNLRVVDRSENLKNQTKYSRNTSGHNGISWAKHLKKWRARIQVNGKPICLGVYKNKKDAIKARKEADIKYGFHKNHGASK